MGKCVVKKCASRSHKHNKSSGITFHTIPKDAERRNKWVKIIRLLRKETDWLPTKSTLICSEHFRDEDKLKKGESDRVYLSNEAIPVLADETNSNNQMEVLLENNMDEDVVQTDEEIEEITESPQKHKMRKTIQRLRVISSQRLRKIKSISQKNRRLILKNKKLKNIIEEIRKNIC